jgi:hypothetical protein
VVQQLYEPLLERDVDGIRRAIAEFRQTHTTEELFSAIARFAVLAYAPAQHAKHAVLTCLSALDVGLTDELVTECAIYAAKARQPWSEPPIADPPAIDEGLPENLEERLAGERWLARRYRNDDFARELFSAASGDLSDLGHKLIMASAAWRLATQFPDAARFATLRIAVWEMTAYHGDPQNVSSDSVDVGPLFARLIDTMISNEGDIVSGHAIFLLDAALQTGQDDVIGRVSRSLGEAVTRLPPNIPTSQHPNVEPYDLARDCGSLLKCHAIAKRQRARFPSLDFDGMIAAAQYNLDHSESLEDFPFA